MEGGVQYSSTERCLTSLIRFPLVLPPRSFFILKDLLLRFFDEDKQVLSAAWAALNALTTAVKVR